MGGVWMGAVMEGASQYEGDDDNTELLTGLLVRVSIMEDL